MTSALILAAALAAPVHIDVLGCYDGDTCSINIYLGFDTVIANQKLRLCEIDTPEKKLDTYDAAIAARDFLLKAIARAKVVQLEPAQRKRCDPGSCDAKDSFGRWLGWLILDGDDAGEMLLDAGHAKVSRYTCRRAEN